MTEYQWWHHIQFLLDCERRIERMALNSQWVFSGASTDDSGRRCLGALESYSGTKTSPEYKRGPQQFGRVGV